MIGSIIFKDISQVVEKPKHEAKKKKIVSLKISYNLLFLLIIEIVCAPIFRLFSDSMVQEQAFLFTVCSDSQISGATKAPCAQHSICEPSREGDEP